MFDWLRWWRRLMPREPRLTNEHPLIGQMDETEPEDAREMLLRRPPTPDDLYELAVEESKGRDRATMYRLLAEFKK